ncbi:MAG: hypothetical protein AAFX50_12210 [Acidobacteriota bacterium]
MRTRFFAGSLAGLLLASPLLAALCWMCVSAACPLGTVEDPVQTVSHPPAPSGGGHGEAPGMPCHGAQSRPAPAPERSDAETSPRATSPPSSAPCHGGDGYDGPDCCVSDATFPESERVEAPPRIADHLASGAPQASSHLQVPAEPGRVDGALRAPPPRHRSLHSLHSTWLI